MNQPVCLISGAAIARRFASGNYRVALLARTEARQQQLEKEIPHLKAMSVIIETSMFARSMVARMEQAPLSYSNTVMWPILDADSLNCHRSRQA
jgi:short-subunit dehydrogenase